MGDCVGEERTDDPGTVLETEHPHDGFAHLVGAVPGAELCCYTREHACFHHAEEEAGRVEAFFVSDGCVAGQHDAPGEDDAELPVSWGDFFEGKIGGDLEDDVTYLL